ncbi:GDSL-type esterase/lipase family protein [Streptomyces sp. NPDC046925]|uniref:GDSL-type esterase/lipase family protein n=1 Tax=Streptomyces sp. NPDC046925 TaxID=3155375 RepID=UPI0033DD111A
MSGAGPHEPYECRRGAVNDDCPALVRVPWRRFVVLGGSGAKWSQPGGCSGCGTPGGCPGCRPWADHVADVLRAVRPDLAYLNLGRRDHSTAQVRARQLAKALAFRGDLAAVVAGGPEALREPFDVDATEAELSRIVGPLRASGADVLALGPYGPGLPAPVAGEHRSGPRQRLRLLSERTRELAVRHGALYVDVTSRTVASAVIRRLADHLAATESAA